MVLIGNGGAEFGVRGYVTAYDADTGKLRWRFYTAPNPTKAKDGAASDDIFASKGNATWSDKGEWQTSGGGGTVWDAIVYDKDLDQIYLGVGNRSEEHTSELQSLMRISYAVFCLKKKKNHR